MSHDGVGHDVEGRDTEGRNTARNLVGWRDLVRPPQWFARPVQQVARDLLGALIIRQTPQGRVAVRLTEVEAYDGANDPGSHAFRGPSRRNAAMFEPGGCAYVYRHLGIHHCLNVVTGSAGQGAAVLLRAGQVVDGVDLARQRRTAAGVVRSDDDLARGPGRLAVALAVDLGLNGTSLTDPAGDLVIVVPADKDTQGPAITPMSPHAPEELPTSVIRPGPAIRTGPRVGVSGAGGGSAFPWRFYLAHDPTVSAYRAESPRRRRPETVEQPQ